MTSPAVRVLGAISDDFSKILTPDALNFLVYLHTMFEGRRQELLAARVERSARIDAGELPTFLPETESIRNGDWKVASIPADLADRRVEITGPVDRKMVINALNSGANTYMADLEDSTAPTWYNQVSGQLNLFDAVRRQIDFSLPNGKEYKLKEKLATLLVRPRGWHLDEAHVLVNGEVMSGSLFDFGLYFFHNAKELLARGSGPYFYLAKLEAASEARLWNDVIVASQRYVGVPNGSVRATVLLETLLASFEIDEILYELRDHSSGLNCGRWDYIFSYIKKLKSHPRFLLPDRAQVTMESPFLAAYVRHLILTCHRRGAHAMGGMAAQIPVKNDAARNERAMGQVRADKEREVLAGHDGTWVAHPALVSVAKEIFDRHMPTPNQISRIPDTPAVTAAELLEPPAGGSITMSGLRENINVALQYTEAWVRGVGCVPLHHKMEDAATAEISRAQVWQWVKYNAKTVDGPHVDAALVQRILSEELEAMLVTPKPGSRFKLAANLLSKQIIGEEFPEFLSLPAYPHIVAITGTSSRL